MYSNIFVTTDQPLQELKVRFYSPSTPIAPQDYYAIAKGLQNKLFRAGFCTAFFGDKILILENSRKPSIEECIGNVIFTLSPNSMELKSEKDSKALANLVSSSLKRIIISKGYEGPESQKYFKREPISNDFFSIHEAFYHDVEVFQDGRVGIWLDPTIRWKQSAKDYIDHLMLELGFEQAKIKSLMIGKRVRCPSIQKGKSYKAEIVDVAFKPIKDFLIEPNGVKTTVYDYWTRISPQHARWLRRNRIELSPYEAPVITVQIPNMVTRPSFPASLLEMIIDVEDPFIPEDTREEKKIIPPKKRIEETLALFDILLAEPIQIGQKKLKFDRKLLNWNSEIGRKYGQITLLRAPDLLFGNNQICSPKSSWTDPKIKSFLENYGPITKKVETPVVYVLPEDAKDLVAAFNNTLNEAAKRLHLGKFVYQEIIPIDRLHPDRYMRACKNLGDKIKQEIVIVVLPKAQVNEAYVSAKRGLGSHLIKSQMLELETFQNVSKRGKFDRSIWPTINNIAVQIYDKSLESGESIWHLASPAGGVSPDKVIYFMGFDVSRAPERRKEAAAYAAVCDSYGKILYRKAIDSHKGEKIHAKVLSDWFWDVASSTFDEVKSNERLDELILFKDGPIPSNQIMDYRNGAIDAKERLVAEEIMKNDGNIRVISVTKSGPYRIYGNEQYEYKTQNTAIIRSESMALAITARAARGTPNAFRLEIEYQIKEDTQIDTILQIFNDLRYLDWSSLYMQPKMILPLHIVQNLAKLSKEDILVPYIPR